MSTVLVVGIIAAAVIGLGVVGIAMNKKNTQTDPESNDNGWGSSGGTRRTRKRGTRRNNKRS